MKKRVLIVEDNTMNLKLLLDILEVSGLETTSTKVGETALALVREYRPHLVLMDIQLPDVSGLEVTRRIRADEELSEIPIIAVTALAQRGDKERVLDAGCDAYVAKPISVVDFLKLVTWFLDGCPGEIPDTYGPIAQERCGLTDDRTPAVG